MCDDILDIITIISFVLTIAGLLITCKIYFKQCRNEITQVYNKVTEHKYLNMTISLDVYRNLISNKYNRLELINIVGDIQEFLFDIKNIVEMQSSLIRYTHPIINILKKETNKIDDEIIDNILSACIECTDAKMRRGIANYVIEDAELYKNVINIYFKMYGYSNKTHTIIPYSMTLLSIIERNNQILTGIRLRNYEKYTRYFNLVYWYNISQSSYFEFNTKCYTLYYIDKYITKNSKSLAIGIRLKLFRAKNNKNISKHKKKCKDIILFRNKIIFILPLLLIHCYENLTLRILRIKNNKKEIDNDTKINHR